MDCVGSGERRRRHARVQRCHANASARLTQRCQRGQSSVEAIVIIAALLVGAVGLGLFGEDGGVAGFFVDGLRRFQRGFGHALSLAG
jgi:hypothetical protein